MYFGKKWYFCRKYGRIIGENDEETKKRAMEKRKEIRPFISRMVHMTNMQHLAFGDLMKHLCDQLAAEEGLPPRMREAAAELSAAVEAENESYRRSRRGDVVEMTRELKETDRRRDHLLGALRTLCRATAGMPYESERQEAAKRLLEVMRRLKVSANDEYSQEWGKVRKLTAQLREGETWNQDVKTLELEELLQRLEEENDRAVKLIGERLSLQAKYRPTELREARQRTEEACRVVCVLLEALAILESGDDGTSRYDEYIARLNARIKYVKTVMLRK